MRLRMEKRHQCLSWQPAQEPLGKMVRITDSNSSCWPNYRLNLTCANRIFIAELQWNPSVESQAISRAIRLGQENEVRVTRYITKDTVEEVSCPDSRAIWYGYWLYAEYQTTARVQEADRGSWIWGGDWITEWSMCWKCQRRPLAYWHNGSSHIDSILCFDKAMFSYLAILIDILEILNQVIIIINPSLRFIAKVYPRWFRVITPPLSLRQLQLDPSVIALLYRSPALLLLSF